MKLTRGRTNIDQVYRKQAEYLLRELSGRFEEQNAMLKEILEAVKK